MWRPLLQALAPGTDASTYAGKNEDKDTNVDIDKTTDITVVTGLISSIISIIISPTIIHIISSTFITSNLPIHTQFSYRRR